MRREKKLFLLAMILILNTEMFGEKIIYGPVKPGNEHLIEEPKKLGESDIIQLNAGKEKTDITKVINEAEITVDGTKPGITLSSDSKKDEKGRNEFVNEGTLTVTNGTGIYYNNKTSSYQQVINNKNIVVNGGTGIELYAPKNGKGKNEFINKGALTVTNGTGIKVGINGEVINEVEETSEGITKGEIIVNGGTGIFLNNGTSKFTNKGTLTVTNGIGIDLKNGNVINESQGTIEINGGKGISLEKGASKFTNKGTVKVTNGTGIVLNYKTSEFTNEGTLTVTNGVGIDLQNGISINTGKIEVSSGGTGFSISGGNFTNDSKGEIQVEGSQSVGIHQTGGIVKNIGDGKIIASSNGIGVIVSKGSFINEAFGPTQGIIASKKGVGIKVEKDGIAKNDGKGKISALGGIGVISQGEFRNNSLISVGSGGTGIQVEKDGIAINEKKGKITLSALKDRGAVISGGKFENNGIISGKAGTAIELENGLFINNGKLEYTGKGNIDENFIAVRSLGGNNTTYLKKGSSVAGKILGANGIDVLAFEGTKDGKKYENLYVENYEVLKVVNGNVEINNSKIELEYNKGTKEYSNKVDNIIQGDKTVKVNNTGNLEMSGSNLVIDFKDSLTDKKLENPIIDVGKDGKLTFSKGMKFDFNSSDGRDEFNLNEALGLRKDQIIVDGNFDEVFKDTAVWEYDNTTGEIILKKNKYENIVLKPQIKKFAGMLEKEDVFNKDFSDKLKKIKVDLNLLDTKEEFTNALTQMSGGVHGYAVDFAAINARTMVNTMRERALTRDYLRNRPINSWTQDIMYVDNNHRLGGLMDVNYNEKGVLGISEKQILKNGRLGLVYGGTNGNAKFEGGENGSIKLDGAYFGGYYNHEFNPNWSLNSNVNFVYTHDRVTRNVKFADINETFKSSYPTYTVGLGSSLIYTVKDDLKNKAHFYAGIDIERLMIGNINENIDQEKDTTGLAVKTNSGGEKTYYSIVPSAGFMVQNTGYVFDKKYRIGADLNWETEVGDIKDGKRLSLTGMNGEYKVETSKRENVFSYSLFGALDLTEDLAINAKYTSMFSDEYNSDMIGAGFEYKIDTMADNVFGNFAHKLENSRPFSDRWGGTLGVMLEAEDGNDVTYYSKPGGFPTSGDYATSTQYKPKMTLSLNDKKSNWGYYFETYYKNNSMLQGHKAGEEKQHASRIHGEVRWSDTYSRGKYGVNVGYRNEKSKKPNNSYQFWGRTSERAVHELRITPNFSYNLTNNITFGGKTTFVASYNYDGDRKDQTDFTIENQYGISYSGFMPRWQLSLIYFREDTFYDNSFRKVTGYNKETQTYKYGLGSERYQNNQLRPSITYNFGNGAILKFDTRITLGNGSWYNEKDTHIKKSESYETRYSFDYSYPVAPGFTVNFGGSFLNMKSKSRTKDNYGNISRSYSFRPNIGFSYSF